jgi:D-tyrosyl-tRNA(Tyr) deacylase
MRVVLQRVTRASVMVGGELISSIGPGLVLLVAAGKDDRPSEVGRLAEKIAGLRVFNDAEGKMNLPISDVEGAEILVVSQFTLYGDVRRGRRPSWDKAEAPDAASQRVEEFALALERLGAKVSRGIFGAHMEVELLNDGPVTLVIEGRDLAF